MALNNLWLMFIVLPVVLGLLLVVGFWGLRKRGGRNVEVSGLGRLTDLPEFQQKARRYKGGLKVGVGLMVAGLLCLTVVIGQPVKVETSASTKYNRDIVLCLDVSGSMYGVDKAILNQFQSLIDGFKGERVGLVVWNSSSHMVFPLTDDYTTIEKALKQVENWFEPNALGPDDEFYELFKYTLNGKGGSLIGDGLTACSLMFPPVDSSDKRSRSIILATDNVINGEPVVSFPEAVKYATDEGLTIYGIRPTTGFEVAEERAEMKQQIEKVNGGVFYDAEDPEVVPNIVNEINKTEAGAVETSPVITKTGVPGGWIVGGVLTVLAGLVLVWRLKV